MVPVEQEEPDFTDADWEGADETPEEPETLARAAAQALAELDRREAEEARASAELAAQAKAEAELAERFKLLPHAYAMVQDPRGGWYAVHLEGVRAEKVTRLEPNGRREHGGFALSRAVMAMQRRHSERKWGATPKG